MGNINTSQIVGWPTELTEAMTGKVVEIGTLLYNPVLIIFDNQSNESVAISVNDPTGETIWRTFTSGEALVMDWRDKSHLASNYTASIGTTFYGTSEDEDVVGNFSISYVYAAGNE
jgi:hypothetical protein